MWLNMPNRGPSSQACRPHGVVHQLLTWSAGRLNQNARTTRLEHCLLQHLCVQYYDTVLCSLAFAQMAAVWAHTVQVHGRTAAVRHSRSLQLRRRRPRRSDTHGRQGPPAGGGLRGTRQEGARAQEVGEGPSSRQRSTSGVSGGSTRVVRLGGLGRGALGAAGPSKAGGNPETWGP